jgi:hypothetical protein
MGQQAQDDNNESFTPDDDIYESAFAQAETDFVNDQNSADTSDGETGGDQNESDDNDNASGFNDSDSTSTNEDKNAGSNDDETGDQSGKGGDSTSDEIVVPQDWSQADQEDFKKLTGEGQGLFLSMHKNMQGGLTKALEKMNDAKAEIKNQFGQSSDDIKSLLDTQQQFASDPVAVLMQLAEQADIPLFFEPKEQDAIPEFESAEDQTRWIQKTLANQQKADQAKSDQATQLAQEQKDKLTSEFVAAREAHPDIKDHQEGMINLLTSNPSLSVEESYQLSTYENLKVMAVEGQQAKTNLKTVQAELLALKKQLTQTPARSQDKGQQAQEDLDPYEAAGNKAEKKLQGQ